MNLKWQLTQAFFYSLFSMIGFGLIAILISEHKIARFDQAVTAFVRGFESPLMTEIMKFFTFIGSGFAIIPLVILVALFLYKVLKHRSELVLLLTVVVGSALLNETLKLIFHRSRPVLHRIVDASGYSFPSGHSMAAFTLYGIVAFLLWKHISTAYGRMLLIFFTVIMIAMIGISRIYLGVHYPSDVLGGYLASGSWLAFSIWFYQQYKERRYEDRLW